MIAGPAGPAAKAWHLGLPPARATRLRDFRVAVITDSPVAEVDDAYQDAIRALAERLRREGAAVTEEALPFDDHAAHHATYLQLLRGAASPHLPEPVFEQAVRHLEDRTPGLSAYVSRTAQAHAQRHRDWILAQERRAVLRRGWEDFFRRFDVLIAPVTVSAAFPLDEARPREERELTINGHQVDYNDQLFWAGLATLPSLPATAAPIGRVNGLPVGVQIIGAFLEDRTTLAFAQRLEELFPFSAPPDLV